MSRAHCNVAVVAFANKLVRIAWAVLRRGRTVCRRRDADGGLEVWSVALEASSDPSCLREGDDEMA
jgi:hypothetical protein